MANTISNAAYTPSSFYEKYIGDTVRNTISIINAPTDDKPYYRTYTVSMLGNVVDGRDVCYLNLPMSEFKDLIIQQLKAGQLVWFGSDVGKGGCREEGLWDTGSFNYELLTGLDLDINKKDGLDYWFSAMNHAMVITGVSLDENGAPVRWKIENSWGDEKGNKGIMYAATAGLTSMSIRLLSAVTPGRQGFPAGSEADCAQSLGPDGFAGRLIVWM